jgi:hypothetical protein
MEWRAYCRTLLATALALGGALTALIWIADPYQNVPFSPRWARAPVDTNQRFAYPAIARAAEFDGVVLGTSTGRLLNPAHFDALFNARFANLAMNSATAWEQYRIGDLFIRSRSVTRYLVVAVDSVWCVTGPEFERYTFRKFPEWMYDDNRWNDLLYLVNDKALEQAVREVQYLRGLRRAKYRSDGYRDFLPADDEYDLAKARTKIYGAAVNAHAELPPVAPVGPTVIDRTLEFPTHGMLEDLFAMAGDEAIKVLLMVPYHEHVLRSTASLYAECKGRLVDLAARHPNTHVVDFMIPSALTSDDRNYWDALHYTRHIARSVERHLAVAVTQGRDESGVYRYLTPADVVREARP